MSPIREHARYVDVATVTKIVHEIHAWITKINVQEIITCMLNSFAMVGCMGNPIEMPFFY